MPVNIELEKIKKSTKQVQKNSLEDQNGEVQLDMFGSVAFSNHSSDTSSVNQRKNVFEEFEKKKTQTVVNNFEQFISKDNTNNLKRS